MRLKFKRKYIQITSSDALFDEHKQIAMIYGGDLGVDWSHGRRHRDYHLYSFGPFPLLQPQFHIVFQLSIGQGS